MTDHEIIEALDCCIRHEKCEKCPMYKKCDFFYDRDYVGAPDILILSLDLINRQRKEIENLQSEVEILQQWVESVPYTLQQATELIKLEAIKEFADLSIKRICRAVTAPTPTESYVVERCTQEIDNLAKETEKESYVF